MAINNWRYVDTDWYTSATERNAATWWAEFGVRTPGGVVSGTTRPVVVTQPENTKPSFNESMGVNTAPAFSNAEVFNIQSQWYRNLGDNAMANAYNALWTWADSYAKTANQLNAFYNALASDISNRENQLWQAKYTLANQLNRDLLNTRDYVNQMFGPNGTLTNEVNKYYDDLWNYLSTEAGRQAANIAAQWVHSWASLWAIRAQQNQAYNEAFGRYVQAKEQEINAKQQIAANLINYMSTLRQEYWDTTNQYIIQQYQRANDLLNWLSQNIAASNIELLNARRTSSWQPYSNSNPQTYNLTQEELNEYVENILKNKTNTSDEGERMAEISNN